MVKEKPSVVKEEPSKKNSQRRYSFTQAMYNWKPPQKGPEPRLGLGLAVFVIIALVVLAYVVYRLR